MPDLTEFLIFRGNTSRQFARTIASTLAQVPPFAYSLAKQGKLKIVITHSVLDYDQRLAKLHPRGWESKWSWAHADGLYDRSSRSVVVAEGCLDHAGRLSETPRARGVLFHELGHGLDEALEGYSFCSEFVDCYLADFAVLIGTPAESELGYLLQGFNLTKGQANGAGLQETFAEVFAALCGRTPNPEQRSLLLKSFPRVTHNLRALISR